MYTQTSNINENSDFVSITDVQSMVMQRIGYIVAFGSYFVVCKLHYLIIIII